MKKGTEITITIDGIDQEAMGFALVEDGPFGDDGRGATRLLVPGVRAGDELLVTVDHVSRHRRVAWARVLRNESAIAQNRSVSCPDSIQAGGGCGGCAAIHLGESAASALKICAVTEALENAGQEIAADFEYTESPSVFHYRNRGNFVVSKGKDDRTFLGSYAPRSHRVAPMNRCRIHCAPIGSVAMTIGTLLTELDVPLYPEKDNLRYVTIRAGASNEVLVDLVASSTGPSWMKPLLQGLEGIKEIIGVSLQKNESSGNALRVGPSVVLFGEKSVEEQFGDLTLSVSASVFSQLNSAVAELMVQKAATYLAGKTIWDLYCGVGGLGLTAARSGKSINLFGADSNPESIGLARENAQRCGIKGVFDVLNLNKEVPTRWPAPDVIYLNPPRRGLDEKVLERLHSLGKKPALVYMSCNPDSFAKDAAILQKAGWSINELGAYDMLPQTVHVELLGHFVP